ncbi:diamine acetyltransferase [Acidobacteria bacterium Mor1]|nr:diamine acetyltransferase [Acidobacteria bacterium Mor1]
MSRPPLRIEPATEEQVPLILEFIVGLAEYEKLAEYVVADEDRLRATLFGPRPYAEVVFGYDGDTPAAFALFFHNYSTFRGRPGIYLENLFVKPEFRGKGYGKAMLVHLAKLAVERGCDRVEWVVLDWNEPAIGFYKRLGAVPMEGWEIFRLEGEALPALAAE